MLQGHCAFRPVLKTIARRQSLALPPRPEVLLKIIGRLAQRLADCGNGGIARIAHAAIHFAPHDLLDFAQAASPRCGCSGRTANRPARRTARTAAPTAPATALGRIAHLKRAISIDVSQLKIRVRTAALAVRHFSAFAVAASQLHGSSRGTILVLSLSPRHCNSPPVSLKNFLTRTISHTNNNYSRLLMPESLIYWPFISNPLHLQAPFCAGRNAK
jgi:hypothetical protein